MTVVVMSRLLSHARAEHSGRERIVVLHLALRNWFASRVGRARPLEAFTPERVQAYERSTIRARHRLCRVVARHLESGYLAGHSVVAVDTERPQLAHQTDTSVRRAHRGHRLGLLLKAGMVRWLASEEPQIESLDTWNAESNDHMIAINERLRYRVVGRELAFQGRLRPGGVGHPPMCVYKTNRL